MPIPALRPQLLGTPPVLLLAALIATTGCGNETPALNPGDAAPAPVPTVPVPSSGDAAPPPTRFDLEGWSLEAAEFIVESRVGGDPELFLVRGRSDTAWVRLTDSPGRDGGARWAPDGTWIAFETERASADDPSGGGVSRSDIFRIDLPRGASARPRLDAPEAVPLVVSAALDAGPAISPEGTRIAYRSTRTFDGRDGDSGQIWSVRLDDPESPPERVTREPAPDSTRPVWHPRGRDLFFSRQYSGGGPASILLVSLDGIRERVVVSDGRVNRAPHLSPDGVRMAWTVRDSEEDAVSVVVGNLDGSGAREVARGPYHLTDWTPDGSYLVADRRGVNRIEIVLLPLDGGSPELLLRSDRSAYGAALRPPPRVPDEGR